MRPLDPRLLRHASAARRFVVVAAGVAVVTAGLVIVQAQLLARSIARAFLGGAGLAELAPVLLALVAIMAGRGVLAWAGEVAAHRASADVIRQLRARLVAHALRLGPRHRDLPPTTEVATLATRGLDGLEGYFSRYLPALLVAAVVPAVVAARILVGDPLSGLIVGLTVPLIPIFMILVGMHTERSTQRQWRALAVLGHHFLDLVAGLDVLVAFGRGRHQSSRLRNLATEYRRATMRTLRVAFLSALVLELLATLSVALIAVSVGLRLVEGRLDLLTALVVLILAPEVYLPLRAVGARFHDSAEGLAAASEVFAVLETPAPAATGRVPAPNPALVPVRLERVVVEGRGGRVLDELDLTLEPGRILGVQGPSGGGKSTLIDLLLDLRTPDSGRITVGGVDLADVDRDAWLRRVAWVPQRPVLLAGTVAENIRLGHPFAPTDLVEAAAALAALDVPLDTPVGEDGVGLSTGQQRRVALARALLADRPLLLLDEPTEGVDADTESAITAGLPLIAAGRTVVLVSHRPDVLAACDRVLTLDAALRSPVTAAAVAPPTP
ncbi:MAG: ATP-binding cassette, subfamily bacterial CydCD, partial [Pseudonocardiales bacterium]|nr:ATP-binding cassette, subfamily bacterial CydCD [Pseudonocardiales bacterium]